MSTSESRVLYITAGGDAPYALANCIYKTYTNLIIIREQPQSKIDITQTRAKSKGWITALGQLGTMILSRLGKSIFQNKYRHKISKHKLDVALNQNIEIIDIENPNSGELNDLVNTLKPNVIFLSGCRILSPRTLEPIKVPVLNYHAGISPKYRGMFGGYWARRNNDLTLYGTTIHLVDTGIDTGPILYQEIIPLEGDETMLTDAVTQVAHSMEISLKAIDDVCNDRIIKKDVNIQSQLWFQPTFWSYIYFGITKKIW